MAGVLSNKEWGGERMNMEEFVKAMGPERESGSYKMVVTEDGTQLFCDYYLLTELEEYSETSESNTKKTELAVLYKTFGYMLINTGIVKISSVKKVV